MGRRDGRRINRRLVSTRVVTPFDEFELEFDEEFPADTTPDRVSKAEAENTISRPMESISVLS